MHDTVGQLLSHQVPHTGLCGFLMKPHHVLMTEHPAVTHRLVTEAERWGKEEGETGLGLGFGLDFGL